MEEFDYRNFLVENKMTRNSRLLNEALTTDLKDFTEQTLKPKLGSKEQQGDQQQEGTINEYERPTFLSTYSEASNLIERFRKEVEGTVGSSDEITRALAMSLNSLAKAASIATDLDR